MPEKDKINNIIDRSENTQEILTYVPHWIVRTGITIISIIIVGLILAGNFLQYSNGKTVFDMIFEKVM